MLFRLGVKEDPSEFYDYEEQLRLFIKGVRDEATRMIAVKGIRRIGKSSLIRVGLKLANTRLYMIIDAREAPVLSSDTVYDLVAHELSGMLRRIGRLSSMLKRLLARVKSLRVAGLEVEFRQKKPSALLELVEALDAVSEEAGEKLVLVFDEAQELTVIPGFQRLLAHIYDYRGNIKLVLAGSEVGLLDRLLGRNNPRSPLYGRPFLEIEMRRLPPSKSIEFLERGFEELGIDWPRSYLDEAVAGLDGIPGWLTAYGYYAYMLHSHREALERVVEEGAATVRNELERFLSNRAPARSRYITLLGCLAASPMTWSELKRCLEAKVGRVFNKSQYTRYVKELQGYGFVEKTEREYRLADPLIRYALRQLRP